MLRSSFWGRCMPLRHAQGNRHLSPRALVTEGDCHLAEMQRLVKIIIVIAVAAAPTPASDPQL